MSDKEKINDAYKRFSEGLEEIEESDKERRKAILKKGVLDLEQKYKEEIKGTHAVDARLVKLRQEAEMPELIGVGDKVQKSRFKDKEKYDQFLAKEILEVGISESKAFGGVILFKDFCTVFSQKRKNWEAPEKEITNALKTLASSGLIPKMYKLKNKEVLITFKPSELDSDLLSILNIASLTGSTTVNHVQTFLGWQKERVELALHTLIEQELAYYDKKDMIYYFPALKH